MRTNLSPIEFTPDELRAEIVEMETAISTPGYFQQFGVYAETYEIAFNRRVAALKAELDRRDKPESKLTGKEEAA